MASLKFHKSIIPKSWLTILIWIVIGYIFYRQVIPLFRLIISFPLNDFSVYLDGVKATFTGENPYKLWFFDRYNYPPIASVLLLPLIFIPVNMAEFIFTTISIICLWFTIKLIFLQLKVKQSFTTQALIFVLLLKIFPVKLTLSLGQINLMILFLLVASFSLYQGQKKIWAGIFLGLAAMIKLTPLLLFLFFILKRDKQALTSGCLTILGCNAIGILAFGWPLTHYYYFQIIPQLLQETSKELVKTDYMNQGLTALLGRYGIFGLVGSLVRNLITLVLLVWLIFKFPTAKNIYTKWSWFSLLVIVATLIAPVFVWQHHFVFLIPAWLMLLIAALKQPKAWCLIALAGTYILLNFYFRNPYLPSRQSPFIATHFLVTTIIIIILTIRAHSVLSRIKQ